MANTIGTVLVAALAASAESTFATITATGRPSNSVTNAGNRSGRSSADRYSTTTFWPSTKPASFKPSRNAATRCAEAVSDVLRRKPITGIEACCARAERGHATTALPSAMNSRRLIEPPRQGRGDSGRLPALSAHRIGLLHCNGLTESRAAVGSQPGVEGSVRSRLKYLQKQTKLLRCPRLHGRCHERSWQVSKLPTRCHSLNDLVGAGDQRWRKIEAHGAR